MFPAKIFDIITKNKKGLEVFSKPLLLQVAAHRGIEPLLSRILRDVLTCDCSA